MTTSTKERSARAARKRVTWICENCHGHSAGLRKRCVECGTSRY